MKKVVMIVLVILLMGVVIFYFVIFFVYILFNKFFSFFVFKNVKLVKGKECVNIYDWFKVFEENGILLGYKLVIKLKGWKERNWEGVFIYYEKGNKIIDLIF